MLITALDIIGFRGFAQEQTLRLAQPNDEEGSGLTILVGPNSGGKSTIIESFQTFSGSSVSFSEGKRNKAAGDSVEIRLQDESGNKQVLRTVDTGGSMTTREPERGKEFYVLPSRRFFSPYFHLGGDTSREGYLSNRSVPAHRSNSIGGFAELRLFAALKRREEFNLVLGRVMNPVPDWTIDQSDEGNFYVKLNAAGQFHNSDGMGEGIVSLLFIVDALYDSSPDDLIVIDEPELSLHPVYQRRLARLFAEYAKDRQIVLATHSPYFVDFAHILNGAEVARVHKDSHSCQISQLSRKNADQLKGFLTDTHNPHVLGLSARETFFLEDGVVVLEGQEDVLHYPKALVQLEVKGQLPADSSSYLRERFFGWGAGGADKVDKIVAVLHDLGFTRVAAILDNDKRNLIPDLEKGFPDYYFRSIPADDIRTKDESCTTGLLDKNYAIHPEFEADTARLFNEICECLQS